ncbi:hypothetical protein ACFL1P_00125 [Patescibacteria group bacterium]
MKKFLYIFYIVIVALILFHINLQSVYAFEAKSGDNLRIKEPIEETVFISGNNIVIESEIQGDLYCIGQDIRIEGSVEGDVICAGQYITISNDVAGSVRAVGQMIHFADIAVLRNISVFGQTISSQENTKIEKDFIGIGKDIEYRGETKRDVFIMGENVSIDGIIGRNVDLIVDSATISSSSIIGGTLEYESIEDVDVSAATIQGEVIKNDESESNIISSTSGIVFDVFFFLFHIFVGILLIVFFSSRVKKIMDVMRTNMKQVFGYGLFLFCGGLLLIVIMFLTILGIPISLLFALFFLLLIVLSRVIVSVYIGQYVLLRFWKVKKESLWWSFGIGMVTTWIVYTLPVVGWAFIITAIIYGFGGLYVSYRS